MNATLLVFNDKGNDYLAQIKAQPLKVSAPQVGEIVKTVFFSRNISTLITGSTGSIKHRYFEYSLESSTDILESGWPLFNNKLELIGIHNDRQSIAVESYSSSLLAVNIEHILNAYIESRLDRYDLLVTTSWVVSRIQLCKIYFNLKGLILLG